MIEAGDDVRCFYLIEEKEISLRRKRRGPYISVGANTKCCLANLIKPEYQVELVQIGKMIM